MRSKLLIIFSVLGIIVCVFFAIHVWALSTIGQKFDDIQNLSNNVQSDIIKNQQLNNLKRNLKNASEQKAALLAVFIKDDDIPNFIQSLEVIMKNFKVSGTTKSVSEKNVPTLNSAGKDELLISFEAEAPYQNLMQFISILESLPYKSYISSVTLVKENSGLTSATDIKSSKTNLWKLDLTLNIVKIKIAKPTK